MPAPDRDEALRELGRSAMEKRKNVGLSLEDIFERTRVRVEYLRGIEHGVYQGFPDLVYIKGFVRTYLSVIGAEELKDEFMSWLSRDGSSSDRRLPTTNILGNTTYPTKGFKPASHFWLFVVLFLVMTGTGWYVWYSWSTNGGFTRLEPTQQAGAMLSYDEESADMFLPLSPDNGNFLSVLPASGVESAEEPEPEPVEPRLHIRADRRVWVRVTINERVVFERTMNPGTEGSWDLPGRATVRYGVANAVTVVLNGRELQQANSAGTYYYEPDGTFSRAR